MRLLLTYRSLFVIALTASMTLTPDSVRAARKPGKTLTAAALGVLGLEVSIPSPRTGSDSTKIIQNAVDQVAAAGGGVVHLPKGTYPVELLPQEYAPWKFYNTPGAFKRYAEGRSRCSATAGAVRTGSIAGACRLC